MLIVSPPPSVDGTLVPASRKRVGKLLDGGGALLLPATVGWLLLAAIVSDGDATPQVSGLVAAAIAYAFAALLTRRHPWAAAFAMVCVAALYAGMHLGTLYESPNYGPLGYSNAAGALYVAAAGAALIVVARASNRRMRVVSAFLAAWFATVPAFNGTTTATALVVLLPLALLARKETAVRLAVAGAACAAALSLAFTVVLGATYRADRGVPGWIDATLSERRLELWNDAIRLLVEHPLIGIGPWRFKVVSPAAIMDRDTIWPHNELLHFGAETGFIGLLLLLAIFVWGFARLWWGGGDAGTAVAAVTLGAMCVHSNVDYILHFPAVVIAMAVVVGVGSQPPMRRRRRTGHYYPVEYTVEIATPTIPDG